MASVKQLEKRLKKILEQRVPDTEVLITDSRKCAQNYKSDARECIVFIDSVTNEVKDVPVEYYRKNHREYYEMLVRLNGEDKGREEWELQSLDKWIIGDILYVRESKKKVTEIDLSNLSEKVRKGMIKDVVKIR
ncbi:hypothetical protein CUC43_34280 (plasmid) [Bacillus thuringiensis LM1212]|uniref:hypothetical protein n=1 Tax=Bacillus cereus group TaxID=86661 RepID=UPI0004969003|nr:MULTISPECIES: hypothetical protein [Bacillus cereus group]AXY11620.1 hypothetical protein CUC43_34280 [Bacillus thuringiensis LM1212]QDF27459.1 hypothetical protein FJR70_32545 [Bacillus tropicus]QDF27473.1 hypothetical protein FJR70_32625 [Bacillus tropicus]QUG99357.1 hypothetical protein HCM98_31600 [Bacillus tropicus]